MSDAYHSQPVSVATAIELAAHVGRELASPQWTVVTQDDIDRFVAVTGDQNWIHTDVERAARELPDSKTIVPGQLLLALIPKILQRSYAVTGTEQSRVAAINKIRFRRAVHPDDAFQLRARLTLVKQQPRFVQVDTECDLVAMTGDKILTSQRTDVFVP